MAVCATEVVLRKSGVIVAGAPCNARWVLISVSQNTAVRQTERLVAERATPRGAAWAIDLSMAR
jgi:hypothetical protein